MKEPRPSKYVFIIVILAMILSIVISFADSLGPTPQEIKDTLSYAGIKNGVTFKVGGQTYAIDNISVSKDKENRYAVKFSTRIAE